MAAQVGKERRCGFNKNAFLSSSRGKAFLKDFFQHIELMKLIKDTVHFNGGFCPCLLLPLCFKVWYRLGCVVRKWCFTTNSNPSQASAETIFKEYSLLASGFFFLFINTFFGRMRDYENKSIKNICLSRGNGL